MGELDRQKYKRAVYAEVQAASGYVRVQKWSAPLAASATKIVNAHSADGSTQSAANQPDKPRTLQYVASGAATANVTVNGTDMRGTTISETVALNGTTPVYGSKAFATISSIVLPTIAATTVSVGTDTGLGLDRRLPANTVFVYDVDGATDSAAPTVATNATAGGGNLAGNYVKFNTAPNGTHNYVVCVVSQEITTANQTTS